jgi:hypothetical protein
VSGLSQFRFRALVTLDAPRDDTAARQYPSGTHALLVQARHLSKPAYRRFFPAEISRDEQQPLKPGDHAVVTITLSDDAAGAYFAPGQHFTVWNGSDVGHGVISRRVFTTSGPC